MACLMPKEVSGSFMKVVNLTKTKIKIMKDGVLMTLYYYNLNNQYNRLVLEGKLAAKVNPLKKKSQCKVLLTRCLSQVKSTATLKLVLCLETTLKMSLMRLSIELIFRKMVKLEILIKKKEKEKTLYLKSKTFKVKAVLVSALFFD